MQAASSDHMGIQLAPTPTLRQWLFRPFTYVAGGRALALGLAVVALTSILESLTYARWDDRLDESTGFRAPLWIPAVENVVDWLALAGILYVLGRVVSRTAFRAVDLFGTQALARWPGLLAALAVQIPAFKHAMTVFVRYSAASGGHSLPSLPAGQWLALGFVALVVMAAGVWTILLWLHSYRVCCNLRGARLAVTFIAALVLGAWLRNVVLRAVLPY